MISVGCAMFTAMGPTAKDRAIALSQSGFDHTAIGAILGINADDVEALMVEADPDVQLALAISELQLSRVVFDDAQIKAMSIGQEQVIVPAIEGALIDVLRVQVLSQVEGGYTNIQTNSSLIVQYADGEAIVLTAENENVGEAYVADLFANPGRTLIGLGPTFTWIDLFGGFQQPGYPLSPSELEGVPLTARVANSAIQFGGGHPDNKLVVQTLFTVVSSE